MLISKKYRILAACIPPYAYKALKVEDKIGTMIFGNVTVQELENGQIEIAAINLITSLQAL
jgi:uncharacterized protein (DUF302 family)